MISPPWHHPPREKLTLTVSEAEWMQNNKIAFDLFLKIQNAGRKEEDERAAQDAQQMAQDKFDSMYEKRGRRQSMAVRDDQVSKCIDRGS